ncbi:MAG: 2-amino-4-hydroxy-6-hydroxymethyldihydropteridine diphosphokinase [Bacteroidota bacterium]
MNKVFIGIGSNIRPRKKWILNAIQFLGNYGELRQRSNIYQSNANGYDSKNNYLNCVVEFECKMNESELLLKLKEIEKELLRVKNSEHYEDRTIDLDILFFNELLSNTDQLKVPHPRMHLRNFVLVPLFELCPEKKHPKFELSVAELYKALSDRDQLSLYSE